MSLSYLLEGASKDAAELRTASLNIQNHGSLDTGFSDKRVNDFTNSLLPPDFFQTSNNEFCQYWEIDTGVVVQISAKSDLSFGGFSLGADGKSEDISFSMTVGAKYLMNFNIFFSAYKPKEGEPGTVLEFRQLFSSNNLFARPNCESVVEGFNGANPRYLAEEEKRRMGCFIGMLEDLHKSGAYKVLTQDDIVKETSSTSVTKEEGVNLSCISIERALQLIDELEHPVIPPRELALQTLFGKDA